MTKREELLEECRILQDIYSEKRTKEQTQRFQKIIKILNECICRNRGCKKKYDSTKALGDYTGFCSAKCQHLVAKDLGFKKGSGTTEYTVLKNSGYIGDNYVCK